MISLIPYREVTLKTPLSIKEIKQRLRQNVFDAEPFTWMPYRDVDEPFRGFIDRDEFEITRTARYRFIQLPLISGEIEDGGQRRRIELTMHPRATAIAGAWIGSIVATVLVFFLTQNIAMSRTGMLANELPFTTYIPVILFGLMFLLLNILQFSVEANRSTHQLQEILDAQVQ